MKNNEEKTNVSRILEQHGVPYTAHSTGSDEIVSGLEVAAALDIDPDKMFKTLVTVGKSNTHYVFMVPVSSELDLKKAAAACGEKSIQMIKSKELLPLTGYIHGGCSPIGMKKQFATFIDETAILYDTILFSAGKIGRQIETSLDGLQKIIDVKTADLTV